MENSLNRSSERRRTKLPTHQARLGVVGDSELTRVVIACRSKATGMQSEPEALSSCSIGG